MRFVILFIALLFLVVAESKCRVQSKRVMPWLCLEKCGDNATKIENDLSNIAQNSDYLTGVSFELYHLGPNSTFVQDNLTQVGEYISSLGLETYPMIDSCCPYPPNFLIWMRQVFANPEPFFEAAINEITATGYTGYNVDWEPTADGTEQDAIDYANFLTQFANRLHKVGKKLNVDIGNRISLNNKHIATWNDVWNFTLLGKSEVDGVFLMSTYTGNFTFFGKVLQLALNTIPLEKLGVGLETINEDDNDLPFTPAELTERFDLINSLNIQEIDIWRAAIPDDWWPFIKNFIGSNENDC